MADQEEKVQFEVPDGCVRVVRVVEYIGPLSEVSYLVRRSLHGQREHHGTVICAKTISVIPEELTSQVTPDPNLTPEEDHEVRGMIKDVVQ